MPAVSGTFFHFQDGLKGYTVPTILDTAFLSAMRPITIKTKAALYSTANMDVADSIAVNTGKRVRFDVTLSRLSYE